MYTIGDVFFPLRVFLSLFVPLQWLLAGVWPPTGTVFPWAR